MDTRPHLRASIERYAGEIATAEAEVVQIKQQLAAAKARAASLVAAKKEKELELERVVGEASGRLLDAARQGNIGAARAALEHGAEPNRSTPAVQGWEASLEPGQYDEEVDEAMLSALMWAAKRGDSEMATLLVDDGGADPNQGRTTDGCTALMEAAEQGQLAVSRLLLDRSADPNQAASGGFTALMFAAVKGHVEVARLLLDRSADPNQAATNGSTALMEAALNGHAEVARLLLDRSADPNQADSDGATALMDAGRGGHLEVVQVLLLFGADPEHQDDDGDTARVYTLDNGHPAVAGWFDATAGWPAFKVVAGCRLHTDGRRMLHHGSIDLVGCSRAEATAACAAPADALWQGSPAPCVATTALIKAALSSWSPRRHSLYHRGVRSGVHSVLLVAERLRRRSGVASSLPREQLIVLPLVSVLPELPSELWLVACGFFLRVDWAASS